ncbi:flagellar biosynthesis protein FlgL [Novosphingobium sp. FKTRR1]|uniref:flagellin N-terminal helical domain-containing protein n=1 Tax=Novosphingobium sp. FKTRR1 TaxID=2879118 RepID=UPI001CEFE109|nr:flagellar biosynthesis protein FlgL [Novosphingobium sp. FKTRR1]
MTIASTSTSAFYDRSTLDLTSLRKQAEQIQAQISSGNRLVASTDDPLAASRLRSLQYSDAMGKIDQSAASRATSDLNLTDSALTQFGNYIVRAKELATQAASATVSDSQRGSIASELAQMQKDLVSLANTRDVDGNALFGGDAPGDAYTVNGSGVASYAGNGIAGQLSLGDGQTVSRSLTGPEFLNFKDKAGNSTNLLAVVKGLADSLAAGGPGGQTAAATSLDLLSTALDTVTTAQTVVGSRLTWIDLNTERQTALATTRASEQADIGGTDTAAAMVRLQELSTVLQASQASFTRLANLSLFDVLR